MYKNCLSRITFFTFFLMFNLFFTACKKYLDVKSDQKLSIPSTLEDFQALMDGNTIMNTSYSSGAEMSNDNFYLIEETWKGLTNIPAKNLYIWEPVTTNRADWTGQYRLINQANLVLDNIDNKVYDESQLAAYKKAKGAALFFRSYGYFNLAVNFTQYWDSTNAINMPGLPLRLHSEILSPTVRTTLKETFDRIESDMLEAVQLLPVEVQFKTQPSKAACFAHMARVYLYKKQYQNALAASNSSLSLYSQVIDYNSVDSTAAIPFQRMNAEVLLYTKISGGSSLSNSGTIIDSNLYKLYEVSDLRKKLFFSKRSGEGYSFKGSYLAELTPVAFTGPTTAEVLLMKAECAVRLGDIQSALQAINLLLINRYRKNQFTPIAIQDPDNLLKLILDERRKELIFRGQRWADLKRLNTDSRFAITLKRVIGSLVYELPPGDLRYTFLIPEDVIKMSGIVQNQR